MCELCISDLHRHTIKYIKEKFSGTSIKTFYYTALKNHGKKVFIFSSKNNVSQELRTGADGYTDVLDIEGIWGKKLKHRAELEKERK